MTQKWVMECRWNDLLRAGGNLRDPQVQAPYFKDRQLGPDYSEDSFDQDLSGGEKAPSLLYCPDHTVLLPSLPHNSYTTPVCPRLWTWASGGRREWREQRIREGKKRQSRKSRPGGFPCHVVKGNSSHRKRRPAAWRRCRPTQASGERVRQFRKHMVIAVEEGL